MNTLYVGLDKEIALPKGGALLITDELREIPEWKRPQVFDPVEHHFDPLDNLDYRKACTIVDIFDALFDRGNSTLTKDSGLDFIAEALERQPMSFDDLVPKPHKKSTTGHLWAYSKVQRLMRSPVLKKVFTGTPQFTFRRSIIQARINRAELGSFDALALALFLIAEYKGPLVIEDFGFYARPFHADLIRDERLIAGVYTLSELGDHKDKFRQLCELQMEKVPMRCTYQDAETLAAYAGLRPDPTRANNPYNEFVREAMGL